MNGDYDDTNRAFLQAFLARNVLTLETAKPLLAAILSVKEGEEVLADDVTTDDIKAYIDAATTALSPLDFEIRTTLHQRSNERQWALVNTTSDPLTQLATTHSADEIAFVKRLLDAMFDSPNNRGRKEAMCLNTMEAVQVGRSGGRRETQNGETQSAQGNLSIRDAELMLAKLIDEGWLEKSKENFYTLSPRALMELKGWLVDTYNEPPEDGVEGSGKERIRFCGACKDIVTMGLRCSNRECSLRLHDRCVDAYFRKHQSRTCPVCKAAWDGKTYVGERAITTSESYQKSRRKSNKTRPRMEEQDTEMQADED